MDTTLQCSGYLPAMTLIHNAFIENYMLSANGSYVKVYLYLSKCIQAGEKNLSISTLADKMDNTEKDVLRALHYWEKHNLIHLSKDESGITGIEMLNLGSTDKVESACTKENTSIEAEVYKEIKEEKNKETEEITEEITETVKDKSSSKADIDISIGQTERLSSDENFIWICRVIESYISRPLNPKDIQLISYLYDNLAFSSELLLYLYEYCISIGKTNVNYIKTVALSWHEKNIKNPEEAQNFSSAYNSTYTAISKALGLGHQLGTIEKQYTNCWLNEWHMDLAVVLEACNRAILNAQNPSFNYVKKIINKWHDEDVHTMQDVKKSDETYEKNKVKTQDKTKKNITNTQSKNQFFQFHQREVTKEELDELEKKLLAH